MDLTSIIHSLPAPNCPEDLGTNCPSPFQPIDPATGKPIGGLVDPCQRIVGESRPGELDVTIRCTHCQAREHYTIDPITGQLIEPAALAAYRRGQGSDPLAPPKGSGFRVQGSGQAQASPAAPSDSCFGGAGSDTVPAGGGGSVTTLAGGGSDTVAPSGGIGPGGGPSITLQTTGGGDTPPSR